MREIKMSIPSFLCFYINSFIIYLFISGFITGLIFIDHPIYLNDLSVFSRYRYLLLVCITIIFSILFIIHKFWDNYKIYEFLTLITYPYLKRQMNEILDTFVVPNLDNCYKKIFTKTYMSRKNEITFFIVHFISIYAIQFLKTLIFCNFTFFNGDLRILLLLLPFSFFNWIISQLDYNFASYQEVASEAAKEVFDISVKHIESSSNDYVTLLPLNVDLFITPYGYSKNLIDKEIPYYKEKWLLLVNFSYKYNLYKKRCYPIMIINTLIRILCWIYIVIYV